MTRKNNPSFVCVVYILAEEKNNITRKGVDFLNQNEPDSLDGPTYIELLWRRDTVDLILTKANELAPSKIQLGLGFLGPCFPYQKKMTNKGKVYPKSFPFTLMCF